LEFFFFNFLDQGSLSLYNWKVEGIFFSSTTVWTQGLKLALQVLYKLSHGCSPRDFLLLDVKYLSFWSSSQLRIFNCMWIMFPIPALCFLSQIHRCYLLFSGYLINFWMSPLIIPKYGKEPQTILRGEDKNSKLLLPNPHILSCLLQQRRCETNRMVVPKNQEFFIWMCILISLSTTSRSPQERQHFDSQDKRRVGR
jgi:hypothetical protein